MKLAHNYELQNEDTVQLFITFDCEDQGWGEGFSGSHGKEVDLSYEIEMIECDEDPVFSMMLEQQEFYNKVREEILNDDSFLEAADAKTFDNEYEEY